MKTSSAIRVLNGNYIYVWDIWGGFISLTPILDISTVLMRPRRPKQYCLQLDKALWHYKAFAFMSKLSTLLG